MVGSDLICSLMGCDEVLNYLKLGKWIGKERIQYDSRLPLWYSSLVIHHTEIDQYMKELKDDRHLWLSD